MVYEWIGVDLDRTLAFYDGWRGETHIGEPIPGMVSFVKELIAEGNEVKIFTARVCKNENKDGSPRDLSKVVAAIEKWCLKHLGTMLHITNEKDYDCIRLYDDIAIQVVPNKGQIVI